MKKMFLAALFLTSIVFAASAQDRSVGFEKPRGWAELLETARKANKMIFVNCYTDWCGPCQRVAAEVFTHNEVADFFNENFVNFRVEMEQDGNGALIAEKYDVTAFPTFLFIDPGTEELKHVKVGGDDGYRWLIDAAREALGDITADTATEDVETKTDEK